MCVILVLSALTPASTGAQGLACIPDPDANRIEMGTPGANGVNRSIGLRTPDDTIGFHFSVPQDSAVLLYVGDQWFDMDLYLYARGRCPTDSWEKLIRAWSTRSDRRVIQFMRPDEQIANLLKGDYLMVVVYKAPDDPAAADPFDAARPFTARMASVTPYCALDPSDVQVIPPLGPAIPLPKRPDDALYQLGMSIDPTTEAERGPFSLMTFTAFVSPPYSDLFDFAWLLDGKPMSDQVGAVLQVPTEGLTKIAGGQHQVAVKAIGARQYPDPALTHTPPTLALQCNFKVQSAS